MTDSPSPKGPHPAEHSSGHDLGFDPDSPDVADPQVDPVGPAKAPRDVESGEEEKKPGKPYDPLANLKP